MKRVASMAEIADMGEESGCEECADAFPFIPRISTLTDEQYRQQRRELTWHGRGRAQGLYGLHGRAARVFAQNWAMGYHANCDMFEREGHFDEEESDEKEPEERS